MHDAVHWMATDPYDQTPSEWRQDLNRYSWACQANGRLMPKDQQGIEKYISALLNVTTFDECVKFRSASTDTVW